MNNLKKCPKRGCEILVSRDRLRCKEHWDELSWQERDAWMKRNEGADDEVSSD